MVNIAEKGNGEGTVFFNKQRKRWNAQYREYDSQTGKTQLRTKSFKTEEDAKKYLDTVMYQKENPLFIEHNGIPLCEIMKSNLKLKLDTNQIALAQYGRVTRTIEKIANTPIGSKNVDEITSQELQAYFNSLTSLSNSSIDKAYQQFNQAFKIAINKGYLMRNPMADVIKPKSSKQDKVVRALTVDEQQAFTDYILNKDLKHCKYRNLFLLQLYMGLRVGEVSALTIHDIDLKNKRLNIHRTLTTDEDNHVVMGSTTKTYAGNRVLPIPDFLVPFVIEQMQVADTQYNNPEKLLFKPNNGQYTRRTNVNSELQRILERQFGITDISTHSLRHTYGTRCIESGMAPVVVQKLMGHKDISVTLNTYTSVFDKFKQDEIDKVNRYYMDENLVANRITDRKNSDIKQLEDREN